MNEKYKLSISIPTYGYPQALRKNVSGLLKINRPDVEIVVVDNDSTGEQIGDFVKSISDERFHYYRNERNIGRSANIAKAAEMSAADYVLLASSDDVIYNDSIDKLIAIIEKNPDCGVIMGRIITDRGNILGYLGNNHVYKKGYDALIAIPRMGVLRPFVLNKKYIDFNKIYSQEETYMQTRLAYISSGYGGFIGISDKIAYIVDQKSYTEDQNLLECYSIGNWEEEKKTWSFGGCYYSPQARADQLKKDLVTIEEMPLRLSHLIKLVDKNVTLTLSDVITYVSGCHDPKLVKNGGSVGFLGVEEVLDIFQKEMEPFFLSREKKGFYSYTGNFNDKMKNERIVFSKIREILRTIEEECEVSVYGNLSEKKRLSVILKYMGIDMVDEPVGRVALVSDIYDDSYEKEILALGAKKVLFFDWMARYLTIAYVDKHSKEDIWGDFTAFEF